MAQGLFGNSMPAQSNALGGGAWEQALKGLKPDQVQTLARALQARGAVESLGADSEESLRKRRQSFFDDSGRAPQSIGLGVDQ